MGTPSLKSSAPFWGANHTNYERLVPKTGLLQFFALKGSMSTIPPWEFTVGKTLLNEKGAIYIQQKTVSPRIPGGKCYDEKGAIFTYTKKRFRCVFRGECDTTVRARAGKKESYCPGRRHDPAHTAART